MIPRNNQWEAGPAAAPVVWGSSIQRPTRMAEAGKETSLAWRASADRTDVSRHFLGLAKYLRSEDATLIRAIHGDGMSIARIALLMGLDPRLVARRAQSLTRRLSSATFNYVLLRLDEFEPERARVAQSCVIQGMSLRSASTLLGLSIYQVRQHRAAVLAAVEALSRVGPVEPGPAQWRETEEGSGLGCERADAR